jgi:hypothetical protein
MTKGDLVICCCDFEKSKDYYQIPVNIPMPGKIYTIRESFVVGKEKTVLLDEVRNEKVNTIYGQKEIIFQASCFTKIPTPDLSEIYEILNN